MPNTGSSKPTIKIQFRNKRDNVNVVQILDKFFKIIVDFLGMMTVLWSYEKVPIFRAAY